IDVEAAPGDLGDHEVGVVAVGGGDEGVGLLDSGLEERVDLERGADGEAAADLLPGLGLVPVEEGYGLGVLVEHRDFVALGEHLLGDRGTDPAATHDEYEHSWPTIQPPNGARARNQGLGRHSLSHLDTL